LRAVGQLRRRAFGSFATLAKVKGAVMKAHVGDRLVPDGDHHRAGVIIGLRNPDGSPPYVVKWLSGGQIALVFPSPYTKVIRGGATRPEPSPDGRQ
jgi:hypothetical protein